jgi:hypothetical protein
MFFKRREYAQGSLKIIQVIDMEVQMANIVIPGVGGIEDQYDAVSPVGQE